MCSSMNFSRRAISSFVLSLWSKFILLPLDFWTEGGNPRLNVECRHSSGLAAANHAQSRPRQNAVLITPRCKKISQERGRTPLADTPIHIRSMMAGRLREYAGAVIHTATLLIGRAIIKPPEPRK